MTTATIGSISHGTLRAIDLLEAFTDELERLAGDEPSGDDAALISDAQAIMDRYDVDRDDFASDEDRDAAEALVSEELPDALNAYAPDYCYFGAHCGDGSDYGFWPDLDRIDEDRHSGELPSGDELPERADSDNFLVVNDHGNATLYYRTTVWKEAWACV